MPLTYLFFSNAEIRKCGPTTCTYVVFSMLPSPPPWRLSMTCCLSSQLILGFCLWSKSVHSVSLFLTCTCAMSLSVCPLTSDSYPWICSPTQCTPDSYLWSKSVQPVSLLLTSLPPWGKSVTQSVYSRLLPVEQVCRDRQLTSDFTPTSGVSVTNSVYSWLLPCGVSLYSQSTYYWLPFYHWSKSVHRLSLQFTHDSYLWSMSVQPISLPLTSFLLWSKSVHPVSLLLTPACEVSASEIGFTMF